MSTTANTDFSQKFFFWGHLAKGLVYVLIGGLALASVFSGGGSTSGIRDVLNFVREQPFGQILLVIVALGMLCYCAWRWTKALQDLDNDGDDAKGIAKRSAYAASGSFYGLLGITFLISVINGSGSTGGGGSKQDVLGEILSQSWGPWLVGLFGVIMVVVAIFQLKRGLEEEYMEDVRTTTMDSRERTVFKNFGKVGHVARALVYSVIAYFLFKVALSENPGQFRGIEGAMEYIYQGFGTVLFVLVSLGLLLYGVFMFVKARYRPAMASGH